MKLFLDTNILIDYFARRQPFYEEVVLLNAAQMLGDIELWASTQSFPDIEYILNKVVPNNDLRAAIRESLDFINVLGTSPHDLVKGVDSDWEELEDCYIACAAERIQADYIITRDKSGFAASKIPAVSIPEWLSFMEEDGIVYGIVDL